MKRIGSDKLLHFGFSMLAAAIVGCLGIGYGVLFSAGLGIGKEVGDWMTKKNTLEEHLADLLADGLGILAAVCLQLAVRVLGGRP